jgi:hypothetical protein
MVIVMFLFPKSADATEVDALVRERLLPSLRTSGARSVTESEGDLMGPAGPQIPYAKVVVSTFDSLGDAMASRESPEGQAGREQLKRLGAQVLLYEAKAVN